jgi:hypothetical protein
MKLIRWWINAINSLNPTAYKVLIASKIDTPKHLISLDALVTIKAEGIDEVHLSSTKLKYNIIEPIQNLIQKYTLRKPLVYYAVIHLNRVWNVVVEKIYTTLEEADVYFRDTAVRKRDCPSCMEDAEEYVSLADESPKIDPDGLCDCVYQNVSPMENIVRMGTRVGGGCYFIVKVLN